MALPEDVLARVQKEFSDDDAIPILQMLNELTKADPECFSDRILRRILSFSEGCFDGFADAVAQARLDHLDVAQPRNSKVLGHLSRLGGHETPVVALWDSIEDAYCGCGCHPDIVSRLWDEINLALPADCRCLVHGVPALIHPKSGAILAIAIGTQYGLRLPGGLAAEAAKAGAKTHTEWSTGDSMDIRMDLGEDWIFGAWLAKELIWSKQSYEMLGSEVAEGTGGLADHPHDHKSGGGFFCGPT